MYTMAVSGDRSKCSWRPIKVKIRIIFSRSGNSYAGGRIVNLTVGNTEVVAEMIQVIDDNLWYKQPYTMMFEDQVKENVIQKSSQ